MTSLKQQFQYDPMYRLVKATGRELTALATPTATDFANNIPIPNTDSGAMQSYKENFSYDQIGNITSLKHYTSGQNPNWTRNYIYNFNDNNYLLKHDTNQTLNDYTYDAHGNITSMPHLSFMEWDYKDRLREVELNLAGNTAYYIYDNTGNRARKVIEKGNIREERYYLGGYEVFRKFVSGDLDLERQTLNIHDIKLPEPKQKGEEENKEQEKYSFDYNKKIAIIETKTIEDGDSFSPLEITIRYQYSNHLGTACLELDDSANIISFEEYHPFGTTSYRSGRTEEEVSRKRHKYVGKERDEESGLYYYGARYYADWLCRFISVDHLQFKYPYYTPYQYAGNKPISFIDLDGLETWQDLYNQSQNIMASKDYVHASNDSTASTGNTPTVTNNTTRINSGQLPVSTPQQNSNLQQWPGFPSTTTSSNNGAGNTAANTPKVVIHLKLISDWSDTTNTTLNIYQATFVLEHRGSVVQQLLNTSETMFLAQGKTVNGNLPKTFEYPITHGIINNSSHIGIGDTSYSYKYDTIAGTYIHGMAYSQGAVGGQPYPWSKGCLLPFYYSKVTITPSVNVVENYNSTNSDRTNILELSIFDNLIKSNNSLLDNNKPGAYIIRDNNDASSLGFSSQDFTPNPSLSTTNAIKKTASLYQWNLQGSSVK